jgi:hypothetical protein
MGHKLGESGVLFVVSKMAEGAAILVDAARCVEIYFDPVEVRLATDRDCSVGGEGQ